VTVPPGVSPVITLMAAPPEPPPPWPVLLDAVLPPPPPPTTVTLTLVTLAGMVKVLVPVAVNTCMDGISDRALDHVVPSLVRTFPEVLGAINCTVEMPLPRRTELAVSVDRPVPPLAAPSGVDRLTMLPLVMEPP
jgi:hypothetical protein